VLPPPELVIDECLSNRLAGELQGRGRRSRAVGALGLRGLDDPVLFRELSKLGHPYVLVTADNAMPMDCMDDIHRACATVAVIDSRHSDDYLESEWYRDVVHRWAHVMRDQPPGTVHRYSTRGHRPWRPR
jgi:hypothetical protein